MNKSENDFVLSFKDDDVTYNELITKVGNLIYINDEQVEANGGLLTITTQEAEETISLFDVISTALSENAYTTITEEENQVTMTIEGVDNWKGFWESIVTAITENQANIVSGYQNAEEITNILNNVTEYLKKLSATTVNANSLTVSITTTDGNYLVAFEMMLDKTLLPTFANVDDIDANKLKVSGEFTLSPIEPTTISKPSGAIHAATSTGVEGFVGAFWDKIFEKAEYISLVDVTTTNDTASATYHLGEVTEVLQLTFTANGVNQGVWYITAHNEEILWDYINKYNPDKELGDISPELVNGSLLSVTFEISESGISSYNRIAKTPNVMAEYLKSAKGGEIIV